MFVNKSSLSIIVCLCIIRVFVLTSHDDDDTKFLVLTTHKMLWKQYASRESPYYNKVYRIVNTIKVHAKSLETLQISIILK